MSQMKLLLTTDFNADETSFKTVSMKFTLSFTLYNFEYKFVLQEL